MKIHLCVVASLLVTALLSPVSGAPEILPEANVFSTSFDAPQYSLGSVYGQDGWIKEGGSNTTNLSAEVIDRDDMRMLKVSNGWNAKTLDWGGGGVASRLFAADSPLTEKLYVSLVTAFDGTITAGDKLITRIHVTNSSNKFNGAVFGIRQVGEEIGFYYTDNNREYSFGTAAANVYYRFVVDMDIALKTYTVSVYDYLTNQLLASSGDAVFRSNSPSDITFLKLGNQNNDDPENDSYSSYFSNVWISTVPPIPEASTVSLLLGGVALCAVAVLKRRSLLGRKN